MHRLILSVATFLLLATPVPGAGGEHDHAAHGPAAHGHSGDGGASLTGEVLDLACFLQHPADGQGPDHASCAQQCIRKGLAAGLKTDDGTVYLLVGKGHDSIVDAVAPRGGKRATVTGHKATQGGLDAFIVTAIRPADG